MSFASRSAATASAYASWIRAELAPHGASSVVVRGSAPHLVLLVGTFPPAVDGGVYRPLSFVNHAARRGWNVSVFPRANSGAGDRAGEHLVDQLAEGVGVYPPPVVSASPFGRCVPRVDGSVLEALSKYRHARERVSTDPGVVILATGPSFDNFIAGFYLSRSLGRPLVLDYRDEWTECPFHWVRPGIIDRPFERRVLSAASAVLFTTASMLEHQCRSFAGLDRGKCHVIPNGWQPNDFEGLPPSRSGMLSQDVIRISHVGYVGSSTRIDDFLAAIRSVAARRPDLTSRIRFRFVGKLEVDQRRRLMEADAGFRIDVEDHVAKPDAVRIMRESHALLVLGFSGESRLIPGKVFEYVAAGPPLIGLSPGIEVTRIINSLRVGTAMSFNDSSTLESTLTELLEGRPVAREEQEERKEFLRDHEREHIAESLFNMIEASLVGT